MGAGIGFINSEQYARRLGANYVTFRKAVAHKRGTLGSRGGTGYAPPQVKELARRIAPPTTFAGEGEARPLWSEGDIARFEAEREEAGRGVDAPVPDGRVRRPPALAGVPDEEVERALGNSLGDSLADSPSAAKLTEREADILRGRLGLGGGRPRSLDEVGESLTPALTREGVRQAERRAANKVRAVLGLEPASAGA